ncbi:hypothetical protein C0V70_06665 [Bacteriovorax stolpii]|uniref:Uncharacterized protein n=1 Tax=Bacteriovorax stolpii TaxID=960 RepID=A0A2K9NQL2_BACTC|nr:winged helix DNA-binding protein [Bacteriovorax stolpii]AUN97797.1 hypothetical protein C0V70_06665 [Bacteriovorax stolpii]TDP51620.1 DNA-binding MarR family transcriptional regulator [Bacteriovorax stolpii]
MGKKVTKTKKIENKLFTAQSFETTVHPGLKTFFGYSLYKSAVLYKALMEKRNHLFYNLGTPECAVLYVLSTGVVTNQLTLGQDLGIDKATIVKIIDKLEKLTFVKREVDPNDRRSKFVSLTPKGKSILDKVRKVRTELEDEVLSHFPKEDEKELRRLIPMLLEVVVNLK